MVEEFLEPTARYRFLGKRLYRVSNKPVDHQYIVEAVGEFESNTKNKPLTDIALSNEIIKIMHGQATSTESSNENSKDEDVDHGGG